MLKWKNFNFCLFVFLFVLCNSQKTRHLGKYFIRKIKIFFLSPQNLYIPFSNETLLMFIRILRDSICYPIGLNGMLTSNVPVKTNVGFSVPPFLGLSGLKPFYFWHFYTAVNAINISIWDPASPMNGFTNKKWFLHLSIHFIHIRGQVMESMRLDIFESLHTGHVATKRNK